MLHDQICSQQGGGGIALLSHTELSVTLHTAGEKTSFEFAEYIVILGNNKVKIVIIYRTLYSEKHPVTVSTFLSEFAEYLELIVLSSESKVESPPKWYKKLKFLDSDSDKKALQSTFSHFICT